MNLASQPASVRLNNGSTHSSAAAAAGPGRSIANPASSTTIVRDRSLLRMNNEDASLENNKLGTVVVEHTDEPWPGNSSAIDELRLEEFGKDSSNEGSSQFILAMTSGTLAVVLAIILLGLIVVIFLFRKKGNPFTSRIVQVENPQYSVNRSQSVCKYSKENVLYDGPTVKFYFECDVSSHPGFQKSEGGGPATDGSVPQPVLRSKGVVAKRDHQKPRVTAPRKCLVAETEFLAGKGNYELDDGFLEERDVDDDDADVDEMTSGKIAAVEMEEEIDHSTDPKE